MARYYSLNFLLKMKIFTDFENFDMQKCQDVLLTMSYRDMYYSSLDLSCYGTSNGSQFISLASLYEQLFRFYCFKIFVNNLLTINSRDIQRLPFDASRQSNFNKLYFIIF